MQELGRLCRYAEKPQKPDDEDAWAGLPYALISSRLYKDFSKGLNLYPVLYGFFAQKGYLDHHVATSRPKKNSQKPAKEESSTVQKDVCKVLATARNVENADKYHERVYSGTVIKNDVEHHDSESDTVKKELLPLLAAKSSADHGNQTKHWNRLLLEAEPQIGKTGVYLKTISVLRKKICLKDLHEEQYESDDYPISDEEEESESCIQHRHVSSWEDAELWRLSILERHGEDTITRNLCFWQI